MNYFEKKKENIELETYPQMIKKRINFDGRPRPDIAKKYIYELVKVYPKFALYKNKTFENIRETITKKELKNKYEIEIISEGDFFEDEYFDIWE